MKKKILFISLVLLLVMSSLLIACAKPAPAPAPTPAPAPAPPPKPELPEMTIRLGAAAAATHEGWPVTDLHTFAKAVEARSNGKITMPVFVSGELGLNRESTPVAVKNDLIQMAYVSCGHIAGTFPHLNVFAMPFLMGSVDGPLPDGNKMAAAVQDISEREFAKLGIAPALFWIESPTQLISTVKIDDVSAMDGVKCRAWDESTSDILTRLGAVPIIMGIGEAYLSMQRGVVDAVITGGVAMNSYSLTELAKDLYLINMPPSSDYLIYNIEWFNSLPAEYQKIISEEWDNLDKLLDKNQGPENEKAFDDMRAAGVTLHELRPEEVAGMVEAVKTLWDDWAAKEAVNREALDAAKKALGL